jgi:hypothetical protein
VPCTVYAAREHDSVRARELCAAVQVGEIVIFDKAYLDFDPLANLSIPDVSWVTRAKDNLQYRSVASIQLYYLASARSDRKSALQFPTLLPLGDSCTA